MKPRYPLFNEAVDPAAPAASGGGAAETPPAPLSAGDLLGVSAPAKADETPQGGLFEGIEQSLQANRDARAAEAAKAAEKPIEKPVDPAAEKPKVEEPAKTEEKPFDWEARFSELIPEAPGGIPAAKVEEWKGLRNLLKTTLEDLKTTSTELAMLKSGKPVEKVDAPTEQALPETEAVKKLQLELQGLQSKYETDLKTFNEHKSRTDLKENPAFMAEYDGKRAGLFDEMTDVAKEAQIDESVLKAVTEAKSEYAIGKALEEVTDKTAKALIMSKAKEFLSLSKGKDAVLANPIEELKRWKDYQESLNGTAAASITDRMRGAYLKATVDVAPALAKDDVFFQTPGGKAVLNNLNVRFQSGFDLTPGEAVTALAKAEGFDVYRQFATRQQARIVELESMVAKYASADPAKASDGGGSGGGNESAGFSMASVWGGGKS